MNNNRGCLWVLWPGILAALTLVGLFSSMSVIRSNYELGMAIIIFTVIVMSFGIASLGDDG